MRQLNNKNIFHKLIMKILPFFGILVFTLMGCDNKVTEMVTYKINEPVFMSIESFRNSVKVTAQTPAIKSHGKMCFYNDYLFISESGKGIHIIDNRDASHPAQVGFIELVGSADLAIKGNTLFADSYIDLLWFDVTNPAQPVFGGRLENAFVEALPPIENNYGYDYEACYAGRGAKVVVGWNLVEKTEEITRYNNKEILTDINYSGEASGSGVNGSMSRFTLHNDFLYSVINNSLSVFNISGEQPVKALENLYVGFNVETIFGKDDNLFMGTPSGLLIYSITNPTSPEYQSMLSHVYGCDPVVVENNLAYVTVHSGDQCGQTSNELFVVDVSDVKNPKQLVSYAMTNPKGLAIDNQKLFLCDEGLKIYQVTDPQTIMSNRLAHYKEMDGYDVIAFKNRLIMIASDGLYQYDYSNLKDIKLLSKLSFYVN